MERSKDEGLESGPFYGVDPPRGGEYRVDGGEYIGLEPIIRTPEEADAHMEATRRVFRKLIKSAGL